MKRRGFLKLGGAGLATLAACNGTGAAWGALSRTATSRTYYITEGYKTQPDGSSVYFMGYSDSSGVLNTPATPMVVGEGDSVTVTIVNTLNRAHSFKIDGLVDSGSIAAGASKTINFTANNVGTHMFYDGVNQPYNRVAGLHGGFVVMPASGEDELYSGSPTFSQQRLWVINECDPVWNDAVRRRVTPTTAYNPLYFTINGKSMYVPGHPDHMNPEIDAGYDPASRLVGAVGDRCLVRIVNAGMCMHAPHFHGNHVEWLAANGVPRAQVWKKDTLTLQNNRGSLDVIYPFEPPPDAYPPVTAHQEYPMHFHDEMTQTAGGGLYQFGIATTIEFV